MRSFFFLLIVLLIVIQQLYSVFLFAINSGTSFSEVYGGDKIYWSYKAFFFFKGGLAKKKGGNYWRRTWYTPIFFFLILLNQLIKISQEIFVYIRLIKYGINVILVMSACLVFLKNKI